MAKDIIKRVLFIVLTLFGIFMIHGEIIIRLFRETELAGKAYNIYYLMPIRTHIIVALLSFLFVVYLLSKVTKKRTTKKLFPFTLEIVSYKFIHLFT